jgi:two-component system, LuxR family, sensor kinase FixL
MSDAINQARGLSHGLNPVDPGADGLAAALQRLASNVRDIFHVQVAFRSNRSADRPVLLDDATAAIHLYRIAQEAVSNATRHGQAARINISLKGLRDAIVLLIDDNGRGFSAGTSADPHLSRGMGLRTMHHRANLIGATLEWSKSPLGGVRVECRLPLRRPAREDD